MQQPSILPAAGVAATLAASLAPADPAPPVIDMPGGCPTEATSQALYDERDYQRAAQAEAPPAMEFLDGSKKPIDALIPDNVRFFDLLAMPVEEAPAEAFGPLARWQTRASGIEKSG